MKKIRQLVNTIISTNNYSIAKPIIRASVPFKKAIIPSKPINIRSVVDKNNVTILWDTIRGATGYKIYLDDILLSTLDKNEYTTTDELYGNITVVAFNVINESETSDPLYIKTIPTHPINFSASFVTTVDGYDFTINFKDNSLIETSYRLEYTVDNQHTYIRNLPAMEGKGEVAEVRFIAPEIYDRIVIRVIAVNEIGENDITEPITIYMSPSMRWAYRTIERQVVLSWKNSASGVTAYKVRYQELPNGTVRYDVIPNTNQSIGAEVRHYLPLSQNVEMKVSLCPIINGQDHAYGQDIVVSKARDKNLIAPTDFGYTWLESGVAQLSWKDNYDCEQKFELLVTDENNSSRVITVESDTTESVGKIYTYIYKFQEAESLHFKVRMVYDLNESEYSDSIPIVFIPITGLPPSYINRLTQESGIYFDWEAQSYIEKYEVHFKQGERVEVVDTQYNFHTFSLDVKNPVQIEFYVISYFVGGEISEPSRKVIFTPCWLDGNYTPIVCNIDSKEYGFNSSFTVQGARSYKIIDTKFIKTIKEESPIAIVSVTNLIVKESDIDTLTWGIGSRFETYINTAVKTLAQKQHEAFVQTLSVGRFMRDYNIDNTIYTIIEKPYLIYTEVNMVRIVTFGDSITAGHPNFWAETGTGDIKSQYQYWLDRRLKGAYEILNKGYGSDTTDRMLARFNKDVLPYNAQYCIIQGGTNDLYWEYENMPLSLGN